VTEVYSNPLQTVLDEFKTLSPETTNVLIFKTTVKPSPTLKPQMKTKLRTSLPTLEVSHYRLSL